MRPRLRCARCDGELDPLEPRYRVVYQAAGDITSLALRRRSGAGIGGEEVSRTEAIYHAECWLELAAVLAESPF